MFSNRIRLALLLLALGATPAVAAGILVIARTIPQSPAIDLNFAYGTVGGAVTPTCASIVACITYTGGVTNSTDLKYSDAAGASFDTFANNVIRIKPGVGVLSEDQRTNAFLNSAAPVTQTITLSSTGVSTGNYTTWLNGSGSIVTSAGTATCTGYGTASQGVWNTINCTVTGTVILTVSGSLNQAQFEPGAIPSSYIPTAGSPVTRLADFLLISGILAPYFPYASGGCRDCSIVLDIAPVPSIASQSGSGFICGTSNSTNVISQNNSATTTLRAASTGGSNAVTANLGSSSMSLAPFRVGISWYPAGRSFAGNKGTAGGSVVALTTAATTFHLGNSCQGGALNGFISRVRVWQPHIIDTQLVAVTNPIGPGY